MCNRDTYPNNYAVYLFQVTHTAMCQLYLNKTGKTFYKVKSNKNHSFLLSFLTPSPFPPFHFPSLPISPSLPSFLFLSFPSSLDTMARHQIFTECRDIGTQYPPLSSTPRLSIIIHKQEEIQPGIVSRSRRRRIFLPWSQTNIHIQYVSVKRKGFKVPHSGCTNAELAKLGCFSLTHTIRLISIKM